VKRVLEHNIADCVWVGEARWADTKRWYTLFSTCQLTRADARQALKSHPNADSFDRRRIRKFVRGGEDNAK
jgi:hypothetical protein